MRHAAADVENEKLTLSTPDATRTVVLGNAAGCARDTNIRGAIHDLYVFNSIPFLDQWHFECPTRCHHIHNSLSSEQVHSVHERLVSRCPLTNHSLRTVIGMHRTPIRDAHLRDAADVDCFLQRPNESHPWSLGFYVIAHLIVSDGTSPPEVHAFTHDTWDGHPGHCERQAVDAWAQQGLLIDRRGPSQLMTRVRCEPLTYLSLAAAVAIVASACGIRLILRNQRLRAFFCPGLEPAARPRERDRAHKQV